MEEVFVRGWMNLLHRLDGPMHIRFIVQPAVAALLAIRAGVRDARAGEPPFLVALCRRERTRERLREAWSDVGRVFLVAVVLDAVYQTWIHRGIFLVELLVTATLLAIVPYGLVRGPARRIAAAWLAFEERRHGRGS
jgi:hypothetical protein